MAWTAPRTWVTGEIVTAALLNTHVRDNLLETSAASVTTAGDLVYADAANSMGTRLAVGTNDQVLTTNGTVPSWGAVPGHASIHGDSGSDPIGSADLTDTMVAGNFLDNLIVEGYVEVATFTTSSSEQTIASFTLTIPAGWTSWRCFAIATFGYNTWGVGSQHALIRIDGTNLQDQNVDSFTDFISSQSVVAHRTGMVTTGARTIALRSWHTNAGDGTVTDIALYAQAYQVS